MSSFIGRDTEIRQICDLLGDGATRLVTLTGPGGIGKTRLAQEVAARLHGEFAGGVVFVPLASIRDARRVMPQIAEALGVREAGQRPLFDVLIETIQHQRLLLILDNVEHVLEAASRIGQLLSACPRLTVLATSRAALRISGEHEFPIPPLEMRAQNDDEPPATRLFRARARACGVMLPGDASTERDIAEICRRLEGIPLAIELAAPRLRHLTLQSLLARLERRLVVLSGGSRDQDARLQTMRDAIGWSYDLLRPSTQQLFRQLAVFAGGFTLDAATCVSQAEPQDVLEHVTDLVDQSMLQLQSVAGAEPRYIMLETIREYGIERLTDAGETERARQRQAEWCLRLSDGARAAFLGRVEQESWLARVDVEQDNLRLALEWLEQQGRASDMVHMTGGLYWYWYMRGHFTEGREWIRRALSLQSSTDAPDLDARALALFGSGQLANFQGDDAIALAHVREALALWTDLGHSWGVAVAHLLLGIIAEDKGQYDLAADHLTRSLEWTRRGDDRANESLALYHLSIVRWGQQDLDSAVDLIEEALSVQRDVGDRWGEANCLGYRGIYAAVAGEYDRALNLQQASLRMRLDLGNPEEIVSSLASIASIAATICDHELAARLAAVEHRVRVTIGSSRKFPEGPYHDDAVSLARAALSESAFAAAWSEGLATALEDAIDLALDYRPGSARDDRDLPAPTGRHASLTAREIEVLALVARGMTNADIADALYITTGTARIHVSNILSKLGARTRTEAVHLARQQGMLPT